MHSKQRLFSELAPHQFVSRRVVDVLDPSLEAGNWGTKENQKWWGIILSYDKNFRFLELCMNFEKAVNENNPQKISKFRTDMYNILDNAYGEFAKGIENGMANKIVGGLSLRDYVKLIDDQIKEAKLEEKHPRELMEMAFIKLSILLDLSKMYEIKLLSSPKRQLGKIYIDRSPEGLVYEVVGLQGELNKGTLAWSHFPNMAHLGISEMIEDKSFCRTLLDRAAQVDHTLKNATTNQNPINDVGSHSPLLCKEYLKEYLKELLEDCSWQEDNINLFVQHIMHFPLKDETKKFKQDIGWSFLSPGPAIASHQEYQENQSIIPFFSNTGTIGYNTILCALFNDYLPVGFGLHPEKVHINYHEGQAYWTTRHDYGHNFVRVLAMKKDFPDFFKQCKTIYFELFQEKIDNKIDEMTLKKELLVLFLIVYEIGRDYVSYDLIKNIILSRTQDIEEKDDNLMHPRYGHDKSLRDYLQRKEMPKSERPNLSQIQKEKIREDIGFLTVIETFDFVHALKEFGYAFPDDIEKRPWKAAPVLRKALLELLDDFSRRHPTLLAEKVFADQTLNTVTNHSLPNMYSMFQSPKSDSDEAKKPPVQVEIEISRCCVLL